MLASSRRNKPKLSLRDQQRFLAKKKVTDRKVEERRAEIQEIKKSGDLMNVTMSRPPMTIFS
ncbi:hypothetical protein ABEO76_21175 [Bacillus anthracis]|uniref:hypothetical protein n=1 Tax=Bacillus anthracis TaxID=1392 RepID=UPI003D1BBB12